jgi:hypothetical protein
MSRSLVGTWAGEEGGNGAKAKITRTYQPDGLFLGETSSAQASEGSSKRSMTGTWLVQNGVLTEKVQKGGQARTSKPAQTRKYQIVSVDDKVLKLKTENGEESVLNRGVSPPSPR